jgi:hypothetical protein
MRQAKERGWKLMKRPVARTAKTLATRDSVDRRSRAPDAQVSCLVEVVREGYGGADVEEQRAVPKSPK